MAWKHYQSDGTLKTAGDGVPPVGNVCSVYRGANQGPNSGWRKVTLDTKEFDPFVQFDVVTNNRFQPTVAGYYRISALVEFNINPGQFIGALYKNGSEAKRLVGGVDGAGGQPWIVTGTAVFYLNGSTDYIELFVYSGNSVSIIGGVSTTNFATNLVGAVTGFLPGSYPPGFPSGSPATAGAIPIADGVGSYAWRSVGVYGDGSDGVINLDGTNTYAGKFSTTGSAPNLVYTQLRDIYATTFTLASGKTLNTMGFRHFATLTWTSAGTIVALNGSAGGSPGGPGHLGGNGGSGGGGSDGTGGWGGSNGAAGESTAGTGMFSLPWGTPLVGGQAGGAGVAGTQAGGSAGVPPNGPTRSLPWLLMPGALCGGGGAGGGDQVSFQYGAPGGGGGGGLLIVAPIITHSGSITSTGGNGGNATASAAGGSGGAGGSVAFVGVSITDTGTKTLTGGSGGTGGPTGNAGTNGVVFTMVIS